MQVVHNSLFKKRFKRLPSNIQSKAISRLKLFAKDTHHKLLNNHKLTGKYKECRSINITGDYRAIYTEISKDTYLFIELGTHSKLYNK